MNVKSSSGIKSKALVLLEMEPLLQRQRELCQEAAKQLHEVTARLNRHSTINEPAYSRWYHSHFGDHLTEIRDLDVELRELRQLTEQVRSEAFMFSCTEREAYERIQTVRIGIAKIEELKRTSSGFEHLDELPIELEKMLKIAFEQIIGDSTHWSRQQYQEMFENFKDNFRENLLNEKKNRHASSEQAWRKHRKTSRAKASERLGRERPRDPLKDHVRSHTVRIAADPEEGQRKQVYRALARKLHPDVNTALSSGQKLLWYDVQAAYEAKDLDRLHSLLALAETLGPSSETELGLFAIRSVSRLKLVLGDLKKKIKALERTLRKVQLGPGWEFDEILRDPERLEQLAHRLFRQMSRRLTEMRTEKQTLTQKIENWSRPEKQSRRTKSEPSQTSPRSASNEI